MAEKDRLRPGGSSILKWSEKRASRQVKSRNVFGHLTGLAKTPLRASLYARVSTDDQQTIPLQMRALREYAGATQLGGCDAGPRHRLRRLGAATAREDR